MSLLYIDRAIIDMANFLSELDGFDDSRFILSYDYFSLGRSYALMDFVCESYNVPVCTIIIMK